MDVVPLAVPVFLHYLACHVASQRLYLSESERVGLAEPIRQFDPGYDPTWLTGDLEPTASEQLRLSLGAVADLGGVGADYALVGALQVLLADGRIDEDDLALLYWIGASLGFRDRRVDGLLERAGHGVEAQHAGLSDAYV